jgi:hypothetical protein
MIPASAFLRKVLTMNYTGGSVANSTTALADVHASAAFDLTVGTWLVYIGVTYDSAATTTGAHFSLSGTATASFVHGTGSYTTLTTNSDNSNFRSFNGGLAVVSSRVTSGNGCNLQATVTVTVAGTLTLRFRSEVGASAITVTAVVGQAIRIA